MPCAAGPITLAAVATPVTGLAVGGGRRSWLCPRRSVPEVRAEEHADAAALRTRAEVDVRLRHRAFGVPVRQRPRYFGVVIADAGDKMSVARRRERLQRL